MFSKILHVGCSNQYFYLVLVNGSVYVVQNGNNEGAEFQRSYQIEVWIPDSLSKITYKSLNSNNIERLFLLDSSR